MTKWAFSPRPQRLNRLLKNPKQQIPRRLKPARDDKNKELVTAYLKVRPFKTAQNPLKTDFFSSL